MLECPARARFAPLLQGVYLPRPRFLAGCLVNTNPSGASIDWLLLSCRLHSIFLGAVYSPLAFGLTSTPASYRSIHSSLPLCTFYFTIHFFLTGGFLVSSALRSLPIRCFVSSRCAVCSLRVSEVERGTNVRDSGSEEEPRKSDELIQ